MEFNLTVNSGEKKRQPADLSYWLAFSQIKNIGPVRFKLLFDYFNTIEEAWKADLQSLLNAGLDPNVAQEFVIERSMINPENELEKVLKEKVSVCRLIDDDYPSLLKEIYNPPPLLYYRGDLSILNKQTLAVVGTRKYSEYGKLSIESIVPPLAASGLVIVSWLALGIDALAHKSCLDNGGFTAAVLGGGLSWQNVFPSYNRYLAQQIIDSGGCLLSEFPLMMQPTKFTFPMRNRIVAGTSQATLVIEAPASSGALITAKFALEQNREVMAVPGNIFSDNSSGTNDLIKQGAMAVTSAADILQYYHLKAFVNDDPIEEVRLSEDEEKIIKLIGQQALHIDKIAFYSKIKINALSSILMMMELKGIVRDLGGKTFLATANKKYV